MGAPSLCLAVFGKLPLRLMNSLHDAYRLGLLRSVGLIYQFRHTEFQGHLIRTADTQATTGQPYQCHYQKPQDAETVARGSSWV